MRGGCAPTPWTPVRGWPSGWALGRRRAGRPRGGSADASRPPGLAARPTCTARPGPAPQSPTATLWPSSSSPPRCTWCTCPAGPRTSSSTPPASSSSCSAPTPTPPVGGAPRRALLPWARLSEGGGEGTLPPTPWAQFKLVQRSGTCATGGWACAVVCPGCALQCCQCGGAGPHAAGRAWVGAQHTPGLRRGAQPSAASPPAGSSFMPQKKTSDAGASLCTVVDENLPVCIRPQAPRSCPRRRTRTRWS